MSLESFQMTRSNLSNTRGMDRAMPLSIRCVAYYHQDKAIVSRCQITCGKVSNEPITVSNHQLSNASLGLGIQALALLTHPAQLEPLRQMPAHFASKLLSDRRTP